MNRVTLSKKNFLLIVALAASLLNAPAGCNTGSDSIAPVPSPAGNESTQGEQQSQRRHASNIQSGGEGDQPSTTDNEGDDENETTEVEYPMFEFSAKGSTSCDGKSYDTTTSIVTNLSDDDLRINMVAARVSCSGLCQQKADEEIARSIGLTRFSRSSKQDKKSAEDFVDVPFAIFAGSVTKERTGQTYQFDKPLPVFPWPGAIGSYAKLEEGSMTWKAKVSGYRSFNASVRISKINAIGDKVVLKFETTISQDRLRQLYEDFPLPREAIYTIDTKTRDIRQINAINWFNGENCNNRPEATQLLYRMCKKTKNGKTEIFSCN